MHTKNWLAHKINYPKTIFYCYLTFLILVTQMPSRSAGSFSKISFFKFFFTFQHTDKIVHFILFFCLAILVYNAYKLRYLEVFFVTFTVSFLVEIAQHLLPFGRSFDWYDLLANALGALIAIAILWLFYPIKKLPKSQKS
ncbi:VanZ family protein [Weeksella virosa]|nr:VanZ family protein [Weeksella virosa]MDK7375300.1 VanZ family protein [Weeksella virosa]MDK7676034.1 VanZ family protein [Weeksella virosa]SUP53829.1 Predicted integral membrane protein [Weeksella virosa]